jgi:hypothetical protein
VWSWSRVQTWLLLASNQQWTFPTSSWTCCWQVHVGAPDAGAISYNGECWSLENSVVSSPGYQGMLAIVSIFMYVIFHPGSVCVYERERERERERGLFFVYLLMWMCVQRWWVWLQGSLDRRIVLKSFFILLYLCLLFFKTCNSAASLSSSNFCVLVAVQFFSDWCNCKSVYTMHSLRGLPTQAWLQASSARLFFFIKVVNLTCAMHIF